MNRRLCLVALVIAAVAVPSIGFSTSPMHVSICGVKPGMRYTEVANRLGHLHDISPSCNFDWYATKDCTVSIMFKRSPGGDLRRCVATVIFGYEADVGGVHISRGMNYARVARVLGVPVNVRSRTKRDRNVCERRFRNPDLTLTVYFSDKSAMDYCSLSNRMEQSPK